MMSRLLLGNIEAGTTDEEIQAFLHKYGLPVADEIEHADGDGSHPAVLLTYQRVDAATLGKLQQRIHNMFWKRRQLSAQIFRDRFI